MQPAVPSLKRVCVLKVVEEVRHFCPGVRFEDLSQYLYVVGPFEYLSSPCTDAIFDYVAATHQLSSSWLSLLLVTHLRTLDLHACPSFVTSSLFDKLIHRCKHLEKLIVPNCKKIPNEKLCEVLLRNPSLLHVDISNKTKPKINSSVLSSLAHSCRHLQVLKLSDYRLDNPAKLLLLCGREPDASHVEFRRSQSEPETVTHEWEREERVVPGFLHFRPPSCEVSPSASPMSLPSEAEARLRDPSSLNSNRQARAEGSALPHSLTLHNQLRAGSAADNFMAALTNDLTLGERTSPEATPLPEPPAWNVGAAHGCSMDPPRGSNGTRDLSTAGEDDRGGSVADFPTPSCPHRLSQSVSFDSASSSMVVNGASVARRPGAEAAMLVRGAGAAACPQAGTREEQENALQQELGGGRGREEGVAPEGAGPSGKEEGGSDSEEDLYEDDSATPPLSVVDCSAAFGCLELETLCLDNVNLTDPILAILMQSLPRLRFLNVSDTDICNPWRLLDERKSAHLKHLCHLDIRSTALSRTALQLVPRFHPDLQKLSISTTMLPPCTYTNIGRLTGVADLELIGGQFYPASPEEIFESGIAPAVQSIGKHLRSLNLTYFAHVLFEAIVLHCPIIETLDLSFTSIVLAFPCPSLGTCCPNLSCLNLAYSHIKATEKKPGTDGEPEAVAEEVALQRMIGEPPNLEELYLSGLGVENDTLLNVFSGIVHPLRVLDVSRCKSVSIAGVEYVWRRCPNLQVVEMGHCRAITQADYRLFETMCFEERPRFRVEGRISWV